MKNFITSGIATTIAPHMSLIFEDNTNRGKIRIHTTSGSMISGRRILHKGMRFCWPSIIVKRIEHGVCRRQIAGRGQLAAIVAGNIISFGSPRRRRRNFTAIFAGLCQKDAILKRNGTWCGQITAGESADCTGIPEIGKCGGSNDQLLIITNSGARGADYI